MNERGAGEKNLKYMKQITRQSILFLIRKNKKDFFKKKITFGWELFWGSRCSIIDIESLEIIQMLFR